MNSKHILASLAILSGVLAIIVLIAVSSYHEVTPASPQPGKSYEFYDPSSYYHVVNQEVVKHLLFCPLYDDPARESRGDRTIEDAAAVQFGFLPEGEQEPEQLDEERRLDREPAQTIPLRSEDCATCDGERRRINSLFCFKRKSAEQSQVTDLISNFIQVSPLISDLAVPDRWKLESDNSVERLREGVHRQQLPDRSSRALNRQQYQGHLLYRESSSQAVLIDLAGNEHVLGPGVAQGEARDWKAMQDEALETGRIQRTTHPLPFELRHRQGSGGTSTLVTFAELPPEIGGGLVLSVAQGLESKLTLLLDGAPINSRYRSVLAIERGQVLEIDIGEGTPLRLRVAGERTGTLSSYRLTAEGRQRETDPESGLEDLTNSLIAALESSLRELNDIYGERAHQGGKLDPARLARADITLAIDRGLQVQAVRSLTDFAESPAADHNREHDGQIRNPHFSGGLWVEGEDDEQTPTPFPHMTLTIMDADEGELLALASYPQVETIKNALVETARRSGPRIPLLQEQLRQELQRTSLHLRPHPIGSVFKPLLAWAAASADPQLVDFIQRNRSKEAGDWRPDPSDNRLLTQCMIAGRSTEARGRQVSHLKQAFRSRANVAWRCDESSRHVGEDLCGALAVSDTYYFLELIARIVTISEERPLPNTARERSVFEQQVIPEAQLDALYAARDESYDLRSMCRTQRLKLEDGRSHRVCLPDPEARGEPRGRISSFLPVVCAKGPDASAICKISRYLDVQLQEVNAPNNPDLLKVEAYLGPVQALIAELAANTPKNLCPAGEDIFQESFRWVIPNHPKWPTDLMRSCTPYLEAFVEGGGLNYWNDIHLVQSLGRVFTGNPALYAKLIVGIDEKHQAGAETSDQLGDGIALAPATKRKIVCAQNEERESPQCLVLRGLHGALQPGGTLRKLRPSLTKLSRSVEAKALSVNLWGKTGTTRAKYPGFVYRKSDVDAADEDEELAEEWRWVHGNVIRKSVHTALLLEVHDESGHARHYVIYLSVNGVDDKLSSTNLQKFFFDGQTGFDLLQRLVNDASSQLGEERL